MAPKKRVAETAAAQQQQKKVKVSEKFASTNKSTRAVLKNWARNTPLVILVSISEWVS